MFCWAFLPPIPGEMMNNLTCTYFSDGFGWLKPPGFVDSQREYRCQGSLLPLCTHGGASSSSLRATKLESWKGWMAIATHMYWFIICPLQSQPLFGGLRHLLFGWYLHASHCKASSIWRSTGDVCISFADCYCWSFSPNCAVWMLQGCWALLCRSTSWLPKAFVHTRFTPNCTSTQGIHPSWLNPSGTWN